MVRYYEADFVQHFLTKAVKLDYNWLNVVADMTGKDTKKAGKTYIAKRLFKIIVSY